MKNRILWLINHQALIDFEPNLLKNLGFEVYIPKIFPYTVEFRSAATTYYFDEYLTIPRGDLDKLNKFNFYSDSVPPEVRNILNKYFHIAIIPAFPIMIQNLIQTFSGLKILRLWGLTGDQTYHTYLTSRLNNFESCVNKLGSNFIFGMAYRGLEEIEPDYLKQIAVYLPIGLPETFFYKKNTWIGNEEKIFFICPGINEIDYFTKIYQKFVKDFSGFKYLIGGKQFKEINDSAVIGSIDRDELIKYYQRCRVLYYHSEDPRHLHYHPLEAMACGMPVVFMKKGRLGSFGNILPGACESISEARRKIRAILSGDQVLIASILESQQQILEYFSYDYCYSHWKKAFDEKLVNNKNSFQLQRKKVAIFLPEAYKSGTFEATKTIVKRLYSVSRKEGLPVDVVLSIFGDEVYSEDELKDIKQLGVEIRETTWEHIDIDTAKNIFRIDGNITDLKYSHYIVPRDMCHDFQDCDLWLIVSDTVYAPILPLKRYGVIIHDCLTRYFSELQVNIMPKIQHTRGADFILTTTPQTRNDVISYHGISPDRVFLVPTDYSFDIEIPENYYDAGFGEYILWPTNLSVHKNHLNGLKAILEYYSLGGKFRIVITGWGMGLFKITNSPCNVPRIEEFKRLLKDNDRLMKMIEILPDLPKIQYLSVLKKAKFLYHPVIRDNGTYGVIDAAMLEVPSLSADYPQIRYLDEQYELGLTYCNQYSPYEMGLKLLEMEKEWKWKKTLLPSQEQIQKHNECAANKFWAVIRELL